MESLGGTRCKILSARSQFDEFKISWLPPGIFDILNTERKGVLSQLLTAVLCWALLLHPVLAPGSGSESVLLQQKYNLDRK